MVNSAAMLAVLPLPISDLQEVKERIKAAQHAVCPVSGSTGQDDQRLRQNPEDQRVWARTDFTLGISLPCG